MKLNSFFSLQFLAWLTNAWGVVDLESVSAHQPSGGGGKNLFLTLVPPWVGSAILVGAIHHIVLHSIVHSLLLHQMSDDMKM
jgi:hypothetical protein